MVGLPFYVQEAGSPTLLWAGPLVSGWTLMRRGFVKHSPKPRYTAYRASALSMAATAVTYPFAAVETGPSSYAPEYWDPVRETLPGGRAVIVYGGMLFGSLCWGLSQRSKGTYR